jgi:hypothetical protein
MAMAGECAGYLVATYDQASGWAGVDQSGLWRDLGDAIAERDALAAETARSGRGERHVVCEVVPVGGDDTNDLPPVRYLIEGYAPPGDRQAAKLVEQAYFLRQNGERPPGAPRDDQAAETWGEWERRAEAFLRERLAEADPDEWWCTCGDAEGPHFHHPPYTGLLGDGSRRTLTRICVSCGCSLAACACPADGGHAL